MREDRKLPTAGQNDANDPERTSALTEMFKVPKSKTGWTLREDATRPVSRRV